MRSPRESGTNAAVADCPPRRIGILDHESVRLGGSQHVVARMAACLAPTYDVEIIHSGRGYTVAGLGEAFDLDLGGVGERITEEALADFSVPGSRSTRSRLATGFRQERGITERYDLFIYSGHGTPPLCRPGGGLVYCHFPYDARPSVANEENERFRSLALPNRLLRMALYRGIWRRKMRGYSVILANSRFSARHVEQHWDRSAEVVYPPVAGRPSDRPRRDRIVSLGRFIATDRKNLRAQLKAFPKFLEEAGQTWSLQMIGFCSDRREDRAFLEELRERARDLPVRFLVNVGREEVFEALAGAKLFWHTAGLGNGVQVPARYREHFGIATVEAMRVGCVPVVPDCGGQPEIVRHGEDGFLCADLEDLVRFSIRVARDEGLRRSLSRRAVERSLRFAPENFESAIRECVRRLLDGAASRGSAARRWEWAKAGLV